LLFGLFFFLVQRRIHAAEQSLFVSQAQANLGRMVAVVSHEIKNPLMIIRASAERLMKKLDGSTEAEFIIDETDRLNSILTGYLDFASGKRKVSIERINIVDLVRKLQEQFAPRLNQDGVKLSVTELSEKNPARADSAAVRQILINLILNGAEAAKSGDNGEVKLAVETSGAGVVIRVEDNGPGIDPKVIKTLFEPFYTTKTTGSGLGLFLSRRLLNEMNGEIKVDSRPGGPTIFTVTLPKA
jgi:signal transduction histidine kinase